MTALRMLSLTALWLLTACKSSGLVGGSCVDPLVECGGVCANIAIDDRNCGACGTVCRNNTDCRLGLCMGGSTSLSSSVSSNSSGPDTGTQTEAGGGGGVDASLDAATDSSAVGSASSTDTGPEPCIPPYESAERCGACDVACGPDAPFCGDVGQGYECLTGCPPELDLCADRCVDVAEDEWNCGGCGEVCPTGICKNSQCVGGHAGHLVVICTSYEQAFSSSPQTVVLGNAVFLNAMSRSRVLLFERYANAAARMGVRKALSWGESTHSGTVDLFTVATETDVVAQLNAVDYDVFLIADPSMAGSGVLAAMGQTLSTTLDTFVRGGGALVVTSGSTTATIGEFLGSTGASLLEVRGVMDVTFTELNNRAPADGLATNVLSPFLALSSSCVFDTDVGNGPDINIVVTGTVEGESVERPVVFHKVVPPP